MIKIYKKLSSEEDEAYTLESEVADTVTEELITGLEAATAYTFKVVRVIDSVESLEAIITATTEAGTVENTTPAAPTAVADDTANTLSFTHTLGTSEILVSINNGSYAAYAGPYSVGDVARAAGYYKAKVQAAEGRNESAVTNSPAFTANTTPAAPTIIADDATNTLDATHTLGDSEIMVSVNNGSYAQFDGNVINVGDVARAAGYWKFKIKAATGRNESAVASSPAFTVAVIAATPVEHSFLESEFSDNGYSSNQTTHYLGAAFETVSFNTNATSLDFKMYCNSYHLNGSYPGLTRLGVFVDDVFFDSVEATANNTTTIATLSGLPTGTKKITVEGSTLVESTGVKGNFLRSVTYMDNESFSIIAPTSPVTDRIVAYGDSITHTANASEPHLGYSYLLRGMGIGRVTIDAVPGRQLSHETTDSTATAALVARLVSELDGTESNKLILAIGVNDAAAAVAAATFKTKLQAVVDGVLAAKPDAVIYLQSLLYCVGVSLAADYRTAVEDLANTYSPDSVVFVDGLALMSSGNLNDSLHPNDTGHAQIADNYFDILTASTVVVPAEAETYQARVVADSGTVIDYNKTIAAINFLKDNGLWTSLQSWLNPFFGVKKDGSNKVLEFYGLAGVSGGGHNPDVVATSGAGQPPTWQITSGIAELEFNGTSNIMNGGYLSGFTGNNNRTTIIEVNHTSKDIQFFTDLGGGGSGTGFFTEVDGTNYRLGQHSNDLLTPRVNDTWQILTNTKTGNDLKIHRDATLANSGTFGTVNITNPVYSLSNSSYLFQGKIRNAIQFNIALSDAQRELVRNFIINNLR